MSSEQTGQMVLDFEAPYQDSSPELDIEGPKGKPGELWNGTIWASDEDIPF